MLGCRTISSEPSFLCLSILHERPICHNNAVIFLLYFFIPNPKQFTVRQFCMGRKKQSCPCPADELSPCTAPRSVFFRWLQRDSLDLPLGLILTSGQQYEEVLVWLTWSFLQSLSWTWCLKILVLPIILRDYSFEGANVYMCLNIQIW